MNRVSVALLSSLPDSAREVVSFSCLRQHVDVAHGPRVLPQVMREHLGDGELIDLSVPAAFGVLLPVAPVPAGT